MQNHKNHTTRNALLAKALALLCPLFIQAQANNNNLTDNSCPEIEDSREVRKAIRVMSKDALALLIRREQILPPPMLDGSTLHGRVTVRIVINELGAVVGAKGLRGNPIAQSATIESIRNWVFKPYHLHGQPRCIVSDLTLTYDFRRVS